MKKNNSSFILNRYIMRSARKLLIITGLYDKIKKTVLRKILNYQMDYYKKALFPLIQTHPPVADPKPFESILHINCFDRKGGAAILAFNLSKKINSLGYTSRIMVKEKHFDDADVAMIPRTRSLSNSILNQEIWNDLGPKKWNDFFKTSIFNITQQAMFRQADIIHLHNIHGGYFSPFFLPELTSLKPTIWTLHDITELKNHCVNEDGCEYWQYDCEDCQYFEQSMRESYPYFIWKNKRDIHQNTNFKKIICPSNWLKQKVEHSYLKNNDIELIYNGIDTNVFQTYAKKTARTELGLPQDKTILLFLSDGGTRNTLKGGEYYTEVAKRFYNRRDIFYLSIGGTRDAESGNWKEVSYINDEKRLALYYSAADLFIYPTLQDVFGLVVVEAISCGTPVITFTTGGVPELVEHMAMGYLARHGDVDDLIRGIELFIAKPELRNAVFAAGHDIVEKRFSLERMTRDYIGVYEELLGQNRKNTKMIS